MKKQLILIGLLVCVTSIILSGCGRSTGGEVVAKVGNDDISTEYFNEYFSRKTQYKFPTLADEYAKRKDLLDTLVVTQLFIQGAYEKGLDKLEEMDRIVLANKNNLMLDVLYNEHILKNSEPTEVEVQDFYNHLEFQIRASHILVIDQDTANMIVERIQKGESFEQLAIKYSTDPSASRNQGDLGYFLWGLMVDEFQEAAFLMNPGEISPPIKSFFGYHIIKLVDKKLNDKRLSFDMMKSDIKIQLKSIKANRLSMKFFEDLKEKYVITIEKSTCEYLIHKRQQIYPPQLLESLPNNDFDLEQLDRDEKELVLAVFDGGQMTISEYLTELQKIPPQYKADLDDYDSLASIVFELKKYDILALEAVRMGVDQSREFNDRIKLFIELNIAEIMKNDSIPMPPVPDESMIRQYYEENPDEFTNQAQVHIFEILLQDEIKARKLMTEIKSLEAFKKIASKLTERPGMRAKEGDMGYIKRTMFADVFDLAYKTPVGGIGGPVVTGGRYSIFYIIDKIEPQLRDYLGQKRFIISLLTNKQKAEAISSWLDERFKNTEVEIYDDVLRSTIDMDRYPEEKGN